MPKYLILDLEGTMMDVSVLGCKTNAMDEPKMFVLNEESKFKHEDAVLRQFRKLISKASMIVGWKIWNYDLPIIRLRFLLHQLECPLPLEKCPAPWKSYPKIVDLPHLLNLPSNQYHVEDYAEMFGFEIPPHGSNIDEKTERCKTEIIFYEYLWGLIRKCYSYPYYSLLQEVNEAQKNKRHILQQLNNK